MTSEEGDPSTKQQVKKLKQLVAILGCLILFGYSVAFVEIASLPAPTSWWVGIVLVLSATASACGGMLLGRYLNRRHRSRLAEGTPVQGPGPALPVVMGLCAGLGPLLAKVAGGGAHSDAALLGFVSIVLTFLVGIMVGAYRTHAKESAGPG